MVKRLNIQGLLSVTFQNWNWFWKKHHISLFFVRSREATNSVFVGFWSTVLKNEWEHESGKCLFGMNLSFLYLFIWNKDLKWSINSNANIFKRKQFNFLHSHTDRLTSFFCYDFSWTFFFFHVEKKKILKVSI